VKTLDGVLHLNPGSAGQRRFKLPVTLAMRAGRRHDPARVVPVGAQQWERLGNEVEMDWFERLMGFRVEGYEKTRNRLIVADGRVQSQVSGRSYAAGVLELVSLAELRRRAAQVALPGRVKLRIVVGDVRRMHQAPEYRGALFQVASQFNLLEMTGPDITPEHGVARYQHDRTQGPACAIAAGAATIYRNYFVPVGDSLGQTSERQLDGLADLGHVLAERLGTALSTLWTMRNGYALASREGLEKIGALLRRADSAELDDLRSLLRIGLHSDVEVTDGDLRPGPLVSQAFCSALPVSYSGIGSAQWAPFAQLVLEAAYEATLLAGVLNSARGASKKVLLTRLGGGAFDNDDAWIDSAMRRALRLVAEKDIEVDLVSHGPPSAAFVELVRRF